MALRLRLVIAVCAFVLTLAVAVGAFVVLPVNHLVDEELGRQAKAQARLAADVVSHGGMLVSPRSTVVDGRPSVDQGPFSVRPDDWDRRLDPEFVRVITGGGRAFAVVPAGDGRLVGAGVVRDDAIERREAPRSRPQPAPGAGGVRRLGAVDRRRVRATPRGAGARGPTGGGRRLPGAGGAARP